VIEFVPLAKVDREYLDRVYYLGPDKGGDRAYRLLVAALQETGRAALGQYAARGQQHLVLLRPRNGVLVMEQLHYADELRSMKDVDLPDTDVKPAELTLALQIIEQLKKDAFKPEQYRDTVKDRILEQIQVKVAGEEIVAEPTEAPETQIIDLMEALKASLARSRGKKAETPAKGAKVKPIKKQKSA